jgi:hypothetical protein
MQVTKAVFQAGGDWTKLCHCSNCAADAARNHNKVRQSTAMHTCGGYTAGAAVWQAASCDAGGWASKMSAWITTGEAGSEETDATASGTAESTAAAAAAAEPHPMGTTAESSSSRGGSDIWKSTCGCT